MEELEMGTIREGTMEPLSARTIALIDVGAALERMGVTGGALETEDFTYDVQSHPTEDGKVEITFYEHTKKS